MPQPEEATNPNGTGNEAQQLLMAKFKDTDMLTFNRYPEAQENVRAIFPTLPVFIFAPPEVGGERTEPPGRRQIQWQNMVLDVLKVSEVAMPISEIMDEVLQLVRLISKQALSVYHCFINCTC
jgi:hypothetical protein